jgi:hypothetical protein
MQAEVTPRRLRIVSGPVAEVEQQLNNLLDDYMAIQYSFVEVGGELHCAAVLVHLSVLRKQALAATPMIGRHP